MKRILRIFAIAAICGILVVPEVDARGSRNGGRTNNPSAPSRPVNTPQRQPGNNGGNRPGHNNGNSAPNPGNNGGNRPGHNNGNNAPNPGNNGGNRPGHNNGNSAPNPGNNGGNRPGHNNGNSAPNPGNNGGNRPGHNNGNSAPNPGNNGQRPDYPGGYRPGNNPGSYRPGPTPGYRPGNPGRPQHSVPPPHRPHYTTAWAPPRPPRGWRPGPVYPTFNTILGITFGTALDYSLSYLFNNGYTVYSYGNNAVYLSNVNQLNLLWPDATLYYGAGGLDRGEFIYSTSYYDTMRYNDTYARLVAAYGAPVSTSYPSNGMETCWFGNNGRFVTLRYIPMYGADGIQRYYTTLSFGF